MDAAARMRAMVNGYQVSQALHVAATLGLSDLLSAGPRTAAELAVTTASHEPSLLRLLRALAALDVYERRADGAFALTDLGAALCRDAPGSVAAWARVVGRPHHQAAWAGLIHSVRTGENAFTALYGETVWQYRSSRPEEQELFDAAMTGVTAAVASAVTAAYDFGRFSRIVDVGGGQGELLATVLQRYPALLGVLFDQPGVVQGAGTLLAEHGVADRCDVLAGDFFQAVPDGADAYLLKSVIHDWADEESIAILRVCRRATPPHGRLLLVEQLLDEGPDPVRAAFSDLNMLVAPGGQERTRAEYGTLLSAAGFRLEDAVATGTDSFVLEGAPVQAG
jgi:hypothetical protein